MTRKRQAAYPVQITARVSKASKAALEKKGDQLDLDVAEVIRRAIEVGLPHLRSDLDSQEVRLWWDSLSPQVRSRWGKRLRHIDDRVAFRETAYRLAMEKEA